MSKGISSSAKESEKIVRTKDHFIALMEAQAQADLVARIARATSPADNVKVFRASVLPVLRRLDRNDGLPSAAAAAACVPGVARLVAAAALVPRIQHRTFSYVSH
jgi:hypothetical protein